MPYIGNRMPFGTQPVFLRYRVKYNFPEDLNTLKANEKPEWKWQLPGR
jgi:uncharacterized protein (DUF1015 family)